MKLRAHSWPRSGHMPAACQASGQALLMTHPACPDVPLITWTWPLIAQLLFISHSLCHAAAGCVDASCFMPLRDWEL